MKIKDVLNMNKMHITRKYTWINFVTVLIKFSIFLFRTKEETKKITQNPWKVEYKYNWTKIQIERSWKSYPVSSCTWYFHFWTKNQEKVQLQLTNFGLTWSEIQIYPITFAIRIVTPKIVLRSSNKGLKIWNGIGKGGQH